MTINNTGNAPASLKNGTSTLNSGRVAKHSLHRTFCRKLPPELVRALWRQACREDEDPDERIFWFASMVLEADDSLRQKSAKIAALYEAMLAATAGNAEHGKEK